MPRRSSVTRRASLLAALLTALILLGLAGCGGQPMPLVRQYLPDYPTPQWPARPKLAAELKIVRLAADAAYNNRDMIYKPGPNQRGAYTYHQWLAYPADLASELLGRDLIASGWFAVVYGPGATSPGRFQLEGGVMSFLEVDGGQSWEAQASLLLTLIDNKKNLPLERVLWQKTFTASMPMATRGAQGLSEAMAKALDVLNRQVGEAVYQAVAARLAQDEAAPKK